LQLNYYKTILKSGYLFPLFDIMHINDRIIPFFCMEKDTHFLKSFYKKKWNNSVNMHHIKLPCEARHLTFFYEFKKKRLDPSIIRSRDNNFFQKVTVALIFKIKSSFWHLFVKEKLNLLLKNFSNFLLPKKFV